MTQKKGDMSNETQEVRTINVKAVSNTFILSGIRLDDVAST